MNDWVRDLQRRCPDHFPFGISHFSFVILEIVAFVILGSSGSLSEHGTARIRKWRMKNVKREMENDGRQC